LPQADPVLAVDNGDFFCLEIHPGRDHSLVQPVQVLQQEKTGAAVYLRQVKTDMGLMAVPERDKTGGDILIFQKGKFIFIGRVAAGNTRSVIHLIVFTKTAAVKELKDRPAALAAKGLFSQGDGRGCTGVSAVVTGGLYTGGRSHMQLKDKVIQGVLRGHDGYQCFS
jgi:hypothetical protein